MSSSYKGPRATAKSRTGSQDSGASNGDPKSKPNDSRQDNLKKFAKYLQDDNSLKFDEASYKPTIRAERHQAGYASSLNQRRNRVNPGDSAQAGGGGTSEDPGQRRRPANRPHIRSYSLNRTAAGGDANARFSAYQKTSDSSANARTQNFPGENLFTKSKISRADVLEEEEKTSSLPKTDHSTYSFPAKEKSGASTGNAKQKETAEPQAARAPGEASTRASRSRRSGHENLFEEKFRSNSGSASATGTAGTEDQNTNSDRAGSYKASGRNYFATIDELPKTSNDNFEQTQSTPKPGRKSSSVFDSEHPSENAESRKTFLDPDSCWSSKYFPPPNEPSSESRRHRGNRFEDSSSHESPNKLHPEAEGEFKFSPRLSSRNGLFEHLKSQGSRRSHSLDSRNRTPNHSSHAGSPSPHSNRNSPSPHNGSSRRRSRIEQMDSLNESNFENKSAFKEHLLNLTMNKDEYEDLMSDFKNGSLIEDPGTKGTDAEPGAIPEIVVEQVDDKSNSQTVGESSTSNNEIPKDAASVNVTPNQSETSSTQDTTSSAKEDNRSTLEREAQEREAKEKELKEKEAREKEAKEREEREAEEREKEAKEKEAAKQKYFRLIQEMIEAARTKYASPDLLKNNETRTTLEPVLSEGLTHMWRFQKTEFGIPTSMGVTSDGIVVVADYGNSCLEYFSAGGDFEHKIDGVKPFGIAVNKKDNIIVGDRRGKAIRVFDKFGADVAQWESKTFGWISGIAILQNGHLVICDRDRCKIGIYTECGEIVTEFGSYGSNSSQLCMADFLAVDGKNRIIVADSGNHCLKLFDSNGKSIGKFASRGTVDGCLEWPKGICVDKNDNIIVADMHNNRVSMFSTSGEFVRQLLSTTPNPYNVCYGPEAGILGTLHYTLKGFSQYDVYAL